MLTLEKQIRDDESLRNSFCTLAKQTFGIDFLPWHRRGGWSDEYQPYSFAENGRVVANVSVNRMHFQIDGCPLRLIQLGTVMTAPDYRNRGLIRALMSEVEHDFADADGAFLFANDSVLDFYPKFGFCRADETLHFKTVHSTDPCGMAPVSIPEHWNQLKAALAVNRFPTRCEFQNPNYLLSFYFTIGIENCVYYSKDLNAWTIAEISDGELLLHAVISPSPISLDSVIRSFGPDIHRVTFGFTPADTTGLESSALHEEDTTLFVKGAALEHFSEKELRFPSLSHA